MTTFLEIARRHLAAKDASIETDRSRSELVQQAMSQITIECPAGALQWAREAHPDLACDIDTIVQRLDNLWNTGAQECEFRAALEELRNFHAIVATLYAKEAKR